MNEHDLLLLLSLLRDHIGERSRVLSVAEQVLGSNDATPLRLGKELAQRGVVLREQLAERKEMLKDLVAECNWEASRAVSSLAADLDNRTRRELLEALPELAWTLDRGKFPATYRDGVLFAEGGLGRIWRVRESQTDRQVLVKQIKPEFAEQLAFERRFLTEARVTARLEHPSIVPVYHVGKREADQQPFYVMRLIEGRTLEEAIDDLHSPATPASQRRGMQRELIRRFISVCEAVAYAHSRGVIHRDLKPANIVLSNFGGATLLDWGLAKIIGTADEPVASGEGRPTSDGEPIGSDEDSGADATQAGQQIGTPFWMAPEQAAGDLERIDEWTDIYGLGATLFNLLSGQPPHRKHGMSGPADLYRRICGDESPQVRSIDPDASPALDAVSAKTMAKQPGDRYGSARELIDDLEGWLSGEPVSVHREPLAKRFARRVIARPAGSAYLAGIAVLVVILVTLLLAGTLFEQGFVAIEQLDDLTERSEAAHRVLNANVRDIERDTAFLAELPGIKRLMQAKNVNSRTEPAVEVIENFMKRGSDFFPRIGLVSAADMSDSMLQLTADDAGAVKIDHDVRMAGTAAWRRFVDFMLAEPPGSVALTQIAETRPGKKTPVADTYATMGIREGASLLGYLWIQIDLDARLRDILHLPSNDAVVIVDDSGTVLFRQGDPRFGADVIAGLLRDHSEILASLRSSPSETKPFADALGPVLVVTHKLPFTIGRQERRLGVVFFCSLEEISRKPLEVFQIGLLSAMALFFVVVTTLVLLARKVLIQLATPN